jgi:hypothetical protein
MLINGVVYCCLGCCGGRFLVCGVGSRWYVVRSAALIGWEVDVPWPLPLHILALISSPECHTLLKGMALLSATVGVAAGFVIGGANTFHLG